MPRIRQSHQLPPLRKLIPDYAGLVARPSRSQALLDELRKVTAKLRTKKQQRFYTVREVADFFKIDPMIVSKAYGQLQKEGVLIKIRSSMTVLTAHDITPKVPVRGGIGMPVWSWGFSNHAEWREFIGLMDDAARRQGFVVDMIFFDKESPDSEGFLRKILEHDPDYLLWYKPLSLYMNMIKKLMDEGINVLVINDQPVLYPCSEYRINSLEAWTQCVKNLAGLGIQTAHIMTRSAMPEFLEKVFADAGVKHQYYPEQEYYSPEFFKKWEMKKKPNSKECFIPLNNSVWSIFCEKEFLSAYSIMNKYPTVLTQRLDLYPEGLKGVKVNILRTHPDKLAKGSPKISLSKNSPMRGIPIT